MLPASAAAPLGLREAGVWLSSGVRCGRFPWDFMAFSHGDFMGCYVIPWDVLDVLWLHDVI